MMKMHAIVLQMSSFILYECDVSRSNDANVCRELQSQLKVMELTVCSVVPISQLFMNCLLFSFPFTKIHIKHKNNVISHREQTLDVFHRVESNMKNIIQY